MKYVKTLGPLIVAVVALTALAASATATTYTSPTGTALTGLTATAGATSIDGSFVTVTCSSSHIASSITSQGASQTAKGNVTALSFSNCNYPVHVQEFGTQETHAIRKQVFPHETCYDFLYCQGTMTSSGAKVEITTSVGACVFTTSSTTIGTVTGTDITGGNAKYDVQATIPRTGGSFLCGSTGTWTGSYSVTSPATVWIDE
jgi:hypothetical protein